MTKLLYRGVAYDREAKATQTLAEQMRRPDLVYRGVEHDGERATPAETKPAELVYRGYRFA